VDEVLVGGRAVGNPEKPSKKVSVDLTGHTYDGRCKRHVRQEPINVLVFVVLDVGTGL